MAKLKNQAKLDQQQIQHQQDRIKQLEDSVRDLKNDKDFLLSQIKGVQTEPASTSNSGTINIVNGV